jgi:glutamate/tyrosine decarboxylase-like PLP-dependent enzyme
MIVGSAPNFPHGIVDDIPRLAAIARAAGCGILFFSLTSLS